MESVPVASVRLTDAQVMALSVADAAEFTEIFERHFGPIFAYLARRVGFSAAEDLASQTFVIAFERRSTYLPHPSGVRPWLYGIATRLVSNHRRSEIRELRATARQRPVNAGPQDTDVEQFLERAAAESTYQELASALADLSDDLRNTLLLFAWADLNYKEISVALGISLGTVGSRISRARQILSRRLNRVEDSAPVHLAETPSKEEEQ
jgi:RNA polymerase sigma-70 factor (ECF subfamily)